MKMRGSCTVVAAALNVKNKTNIWQFDAVNIGKHGWLIFGKI